MKEKLIALCADRDSHLTLAENALKAGNQDTYREEMNKIENINGDIQDVQKLLAEQERVLDQRQISAAEMRDMAEERGSLLMRGEQITFTANELRRGMRNADGDGTLAGGSTLVPPVGSGMDIRNPVGGSVSRIIDQVTIQDCTGMSGWVEPYLVAPQTAYADDVASLAGTARTASDPTFAYSEIKPYEVNTTSFVDRNINRLSPAAYYQKVYSLAMDAMRRKIATLIVNGDNEASHVFHGIKTATNKAGSAIYTVAEASALDQNILDAMYFAYGDTESIGEGAQLYLTMADLKALGQVRNNDLERIFRCQHTGGNFGTIDDFGAMYPYNISKDLTSFASASVNGISMLYGDPANFMLGLFGDMTVRMDESYKAQQRMLTVLGDAMVGGNLIRHNGFVLLKKVAAATLSSIAVTTAPTTTTYTAGQAFDPTGMVVTGTYSDGSTGVIASPTVLGGASLTQGQSSVTIAAPAGLGVVTTTQAITVNAAG